MTADGAHRHVQKEGVRRDRRDLEHGFMALWIVGVKHSRVDRCARQWCGLECAHRAQPPQGRRAGQ